MRSLNLIVVMHAGNRLPCAPKLQYERLEKNFFLNAKSMKTRNVPKVKYGGKCISAHAQANIVLGAENI